MLGYCEKMQFFSSTTNEWPQMNDQIDDEKSVTMEKLQSSPALRCPRCDSSNTKFCYYNNYSLSQPRHFCKSCKRYWTRGGTLRNVPVGGGCRKNKRAKRPPPATSSASIDAPPPLPASSSTSSSSNPSSVQPNPLFYGILPTNHPSELTLPYPLTINSRASNINHSADLSGFDLQPQFNGLGLGFSSDVPDNNFGFVNPNKQIQDFLTSNSLLSGYAVFGSTTSASPTIASFLAPRAVHEQPKSITNSLKEVKMEESQNRLSLDNFPLQNQMDQISPSDSSMYWNTTSTGAWLDPSNVGSSVPSLI